MHGSPPPPEYVRTLRELLALASGNPRLEAAVEAFALSVYEHALKTGYDMGYEDGMKKGRIRGRRRGRGLPEEPKRPGRPMSIDTIIKKLGGWPKNK
jgi:hypothetical protein